MEVANTTAHYGSIVRRCIRQSDRTAKSIALELEMNPRTLYKMYSKPNLDTGFLRRIEAILNVNILHMRVNLEEETDKNAELVAREILDKVPPDQVCLVMAKAWLMLREAHFELAREYQVLFDKSSLAADEIRLTKERDAMLNAPDEN